MTAKNERPGGSQGASEGIDSLTIPLISQNETAAQAPTAACSAGGRWTRQETRQIGLERIKVIDRIIEPTKARIGAMAKSLSGPLGQIEPIIVAKYLASSWKLVTGATRLAAAKQLGWKSIAATIIAADNDFEYRLIEIAENLDRHDLSENERSKLKQEEKILRTRREAHFEEMLTHPAAVQVPPNPSKKVTGRPKGRPKGGVRNAARKAGIPKSTAHDLLKKKSGISSGGRGPDEIPKSVAPTDNASGTPINPKKSAQALAEFKFACKEWLPKMCGDDLQHAIDHFGEVVVDLEIAAQKAVAS